ncbi:MAG TPA: hypothetical protein VMR97_10875 [Acidimicrobiales bacterium]|nr:hypothetical protein [Acidimicrobiales bacterium]
MTTPGTHGAAAGGVEVVSVRPEPPPDVLAAIVAAVDEAWPRPTAPEARSRSEGSAWRFSGRWWAKPSQARRDRPWASR